MAEHEALLKLNLHAPNSDVAVPVASLFEGRQLLYVKNSLRESPIMMGTHPIAPCDSHINVVVCYRIIHLLRRWG